MIKAIKRAIAGGPVEYVLAPINKMVKRAAKERERLSRKIQRLDDENDKARHHMTVIQTRINRRNEQQEKLWRQQRKLDKIVATLEDAFDV